MKNLHAESRQPSQNFFRMLFLLAKWHMIAQWRDPSYSIMRLASSFLVSLYMGVLFSGVQDEDVSSTVFSIGAICFFCIYFIPMKASIIPLVEDRDVLYRESLSGLYSRFTYGLGLLLADIPIHMLNGSIMFYFLVGFQREADRIGYFALLIIMSSFVIMSLGQVSKPLQHIGHKRSARIELLSYGTRLCLAQFMHSGLASYWLWGSIPSASPPTKGLRLRDQHLQIRGLHVRQDNPRDQ